MHFPESLATMYQTKVTLADRTQITAVRAFVRGFAGYTSLAQWNTRGLTTEKVTQVVLEAMQDKDITMQELRGIKLFHADFMRHSCQKPGQKPGLFAALFASRTTPAAQGENPSEETNFETTVQRVYAERVKVLIGEKKRERVTPSLSLPPKTKEEQQVEQASPSRTAIADVRTNIEQVTELCRSSIKEKEIRTEALDRLRKVITQANQVVQAVASETREEFLLFYLEHIEEWDKVRQQLLGDPKTVGHATYMETILKRTEVVVVEAKIAGVKREIEQVTELCRSSIKEKEVRAEALDRLRKVIIQANQVVQKTALKTREEFLSFYLQHIEEWDDVREDLLRIPETVGYATNMGTILSKVKYS